MEFLFKNASGVLVAPHSETEDLLPLSAAAHHLVRGVASRARETRAFLVFCRRGARDLNFSAMSNAGNVLLYHKYNIVRNHR